MLKGGKFLLRKWRSNEPRILQQLENNKTVDLLTIDRDVAKTLGLLWNSSQNMLQYKTDLYIPKSITKRTVLSQISQIFDLLELVGPVLITGKIFMQRLWMED